MISNFILVEEFLKKSGL